MSPPPAEPGPLAKFFALVLGAALLVLGFMFSVVLLGVLVVLGLGVWGYFWWKTRDLRRMMREQQAMREQTMGQQADTSAATGHVIEGEAVIIEEVHDASRPPR